MNELQSRDRTDFLPGLACTMLGVRTARLEGDRHSTRSGL